MKCPNPVVIPYGRKGRYIILDCGQDYAGERYFCDTCESALRIVFPQGWRYVPGDVCPHGRWLGNAGDPDYTCAACEAGE